MNTTPIRFAGAPVTWSFWCPWAFLLALYLTVPLLSKHPPSPEHPEVFEQAGQDWESYPDNWATSLTPVTTNEIPWEPFVDPLPVFHWPDIATLSNYLTTVHEYRYQYSTDCVEWTTSFVGWSDDALVPIMVRQLFEESFARQQAQGTNWPAMLLWRARAITNAP